MFRRMWKKVLALVLLAGCTLFAAPAQSGEPVTVKAFVLSMFEVGENTGDFAGEFQHWYEKFWLDRSISFDVPGAYAPVFVNEDGVAGTVTGMGKARAAATLMAILKDPRFDFSETWFITSGCAGVAPQRGTLGDVFICDWVVDFDLGHCWKESDGVPGEPVFTVPDNYKDNASIALNSALAQKALKAAETVEFQDDPKAEAYRQKYQEEAARAKPSLRTGASVTGDNYWHGKGSSQQAMELCKLHGAPEYGVTQMEDNAFAIVLRSLGLLDRYLVIRDIVNFDQPHPGQTVVESLDASSGGFSIGMVNGFRVGSAIVADILKNPAEWEKTLPQTNP